VPGRVSVPAILVLVLVIAQGIWQLQPVGSSYHPLAEEGYFLEHHSMVQIWYIHYVSMMPGNGSNAPSLRTAHCAAVAVRQRTLADHC